MSDIAGDAGNAAAGVSDSVGDATAGAEQSYSSEDSGQSNSGGLNPAWDDVLKLIPSQLHDGVVPHLKKWDSNFQTKLSEVQSQYSQFDPYKDIPAEQLQQAMNFYQVMEQNPEAVYQQMQEFYGFGGGDQGQQAQEEDGGADDEFDLNAGDDITKHPKFQELMQNQEVLAQVLVQQQEQEEYAAFEQEIDDEFANILEANPDFSEEDQVQVYRIAAASEISLTEAAEQLKTYLEGHAQRVSAPRAPSVMGAGGYVPATQNVDPTKLDGKGTRNLVADMLRQAQERG